MNNYISDTIALIIFIGIALLTKLALGLNSIQTFVVGFIYIIVYVISDTIGYNEGTQELRSKRNAKSVRRVI